MLGKSINHAVFRSSFSCIRMSLEPEQFLTRRQRAHTACVKLCGMPFSVSGSMTARWPWSMCIIWRLANNTTVHLSLGGEHRVILLKHKRSAQINCPVWLAGRDPWLCGIDTCYWSWFCSMSFLHEQSFDYPWWIWY